MKISELEVDQKIVEEGHWVSNIPELTGVRLKVRGSNNKDWRRMAQRLINAVPRKLRANGMLDPDEADKISATILLIPVCWIGKASRTTTARRSLTTRKRPRSIWPANVSVPACSLPAIRWRKASKTKSRKSRETNRGARVVRQVRHSS
jgi:hypothetical protein